MANPHPIAILNHRFADPGIPNVSLIQWDLVLDQRLVMMKNVQTVWKEKPRTSSPTAPYPIPDTPPASEDAHRAMPERSGDAVRIGMILTFQFLVGVGVGWLVWG